MPERRFLQQGNAAIKIAIEADPSSSTAVGPDVVRSVQLIADLLARGIQDLPEGAPDRVEVSFGLGIATDGNVLITMGETARNFEVTLSWGRGAGLPADLASTAASSAIPG